MEHIKQEQARQSKAVGGAGGATTLADYEAQKPNINHTSGDPSGSSQESSNFDLAQLQDFLLADIAAPPTNSPRDLTVEQLEALLAEKRREEARRAHRQLRASQNQPGQLPAAPKSLNSEVKSAPNPTHRPPAPNNSTPIANSGTAGPSAYDLAKAQRFEPAGLVAHSKHDPEQPRSGQRVLNFLGYTVEALVILAALFLFVNWGLQQAGVSLNVLGPAPVADFSVVASRPGGILLVANAGGSLKLPATATPVPPSATTNNSSPGPAIVAPTPTPWRVAPISGPVAVAPTPTPAIAQPVLQSFEQGAEVTASLPRRLVIPRLNVDTSVKEVTINLGNWQVADNAAGHHLGTAMPGRPGNMVLAGHRDIRGSIFLRLNELQKGDEFKVYTDTAVYRYIVTETSEVAPTEISVMAATLDPTATLITCTPIGLATRRLIVKARLEK